MVNGLKRTGVWAAAAALTLASFATAADAQTVETFDRPDGSLGANYTTQSGGIVIANGAATSLYPFSPNFVTLNGASATTASIDVANRAGNYGYVALSFGYRQNFDLDSYFVKVQDNNGDGLFDRYAFRRGNDYSDSSLLFASLDTEFRTGTIQVSYIGTVAMLAISSAAGTQVYSFDYGFTPASQNVGFGVSANGVADNFRVGAATAVPGPVAGAGFLPLMGLAGAWLAGRRRTPSAA